MGEIISGNAFGERLLLALGFGEHQRVRELVMRIHVDGPVTVKFVQVLSSGVRVQGEGYVTNAHADNVIHEITHFRSNGFREFTRLDQKYDTGFLIADGPAERLARAVLAGDARAALVLADYIQEEWIKHCEGRE